MLNNDPFNLRDSAGKLDPLKCLAFARSSSLRNDGGVASDAAIELAEVVVPGLVAEITGRQDDAHRAQAEEYFSEAQSKHLAKLKKALDRVQMKLGLTKMEFIIPPATGSKDDPIIVHAEIPAGDWENVPELQARLKQLEAARKND